MWEKWLMKNTAVLGRDSDGEEEEEDEERRKHDDGERECR